MAKAKEETETAPETEAAPTSKKAPKPDGFVSPYEFADQLSDHVGRTIRPQTVYGFVRNETTNADGTPFPVEKNTDDSYMVPTEAALAWWDQRQADKAARAAAKTAADEAAVAQAEEAASEE